MSKINKLLTLIILILTINICFMTISINIKKVYADKDINYFSIFDYNGNIILEKEEVVIGDIFITEDFKKYEIIKIDDDKKIGHAKFIDVVEMPKIDFSQYPNRVSVLNKSIGLYCTHNDESYVPTDGVESVYGKGGIHDVARKMQSIFLSFGIDATFDETLHIPHDYYAYSRSKNTANRLLKNSPQAMFDIHRDGAPRKNYVINVDGKICSKIRIVIGKSNDNYLANEKFALYLLSIGKIYYPWLFTDIYYANGHYNQSLDGKMLLFEMGSHLVEKEAVLNSVEPLCKIINVALFNTSVNTETGKLTINGSTNNENEISIPNAIDNEFVSKSDKIGIVILGIISLGVVGTICYLILKNKKML